MTLAMMEITQNSLAVNLTDGSALIYQALHLAKSLPFTDKMGKNSRLSVKIQTFRTLVYGQMLQKAACVRKSSA
ncbi:hypothetical protein HMPREF0542_10798 [Ligilactobacillus ruminis ATCC 25644]|uniref:Uncharacterized protein n=1 Tax=Ligilactobacillus ruminis ATCC 25644 TaxID=525362 RepID=E7FPH1_9LACO|nr:hypothetical protein HMPREF0542_10798 [Ligilactobacillus ruminis ATCC 25644]